MIEVIRDMTKIAKADRISYWEAIEQDRNNRGMSVSGYCEETGIHIKKYYYWYKRLRAAEGLESVKSHNDAKIESSKVLMEVKLPAQHVVEHGVQLKSGEVAIEAFGMRITANNEYPINHLTEILREMSRC